MPQMAPMNWIFLLLLFMFINLFMMIYIYFNLTNKLFKDKVYKKYYQIFW